MIQIDQQRTIASLVPLLERLFEVSGQKIRNLHRSWDPAKGAPVFTVKGAYTSRGWTEWTQGFQFGSAILQFDATGDKEALQVGLEGTMREMPRHVSHVGVHDHGFNTISTCGNLLRLLKEKKLPANEWE